MFACLCVVVFVHLLLDPISHCVLEKKNKVYGKSSTQQGPSNLIQTPSLWKTKPWGILFEWWPIIQANHAINGAGVICCIIFWCATFQVDVTTKNWSLSFWVRAQACICMCCLLPKLVQDPISIDGLDWRVVVLVVRLVHWMPVIVVNPDPLTLGWTVCSHRIWQKVPHFAPWYQGPHWEHGCWLRLMPTDNSFR